MTQLGYLVSAICFVVALRGLAHPKTAPVGMSVGIAGMALAVGITMFQPQMQSLLWPAVAMAAGAAVGLLIAARIKMTALPQLVAGFHSLVGLAAVTVAAAAFYNPAAYGILSENGQSIRTASLVEMGIGSIIGAITFSGSVVAFAKLQGLVSGSPLVFKFQHPLNLLLGLAILALAAIFAISGGDGGQFWLMTALAAIIGVTLIIPIGGADMPVVVSMLNSYSGWAAAGIGFTLANPLLIIGGSLVGASGAILSYIMCKGMNRSFISVILGGFGGESEAPDVAERGSVKSGNAEDAAFILQNADSVIVVPGYGMAVAQAQHVVAAVSKSLKEKGATVRYAVHPVAGRMPGHMNVLLAEANVEYEDVLELEEINSDFGSTDVALVIGANDITNPSAKTDKTSPIYGMPILEVEAAGTVLFVKRSLGSGYAGVNNPLFFRDNTMMLFGDAKKMGEDILKAL